MNALKFSKYKKCGPTKVSRPLGHGALALAAEYIALVRFLLDPNRATRWAHTTNDALHKALSPLPKLIEDVKGTSIILSCLCAKIQQ